MVPINQQRLRLLAFSFFVLVLAGLFVGGHQPGSGNLIPSPWDKLAHFALYGILTILAGIAFGKISHPLLGLIIISIGGADEIHQIFVPGRHAGLDDLMADIAGYLAALILIAWLSRKTRMTPRVS